MNRKLKQYGRAEKDDSQIKWEKADPTTAEKLRAVSRRQSMHGGVWGWVIISLFGIISVRLFLFLFFELKAPLYFAVPVMTVSLIFIGIFLFSVLMQNPGLHRKMYPNVWIFHSKCGSIINYIPSQRSIGTGMGVFHKGGQKIYLDVSGDGYKSDPVGKDYIFYKFNERRGNAWQAVQADKLDTI